jgi:hypothetical protein
MPHENTPGPDTLARGYPYQKCPARAFVMHSPKADANALVLLLLLVCSLVASSEELCDCKAPVKTIWSERPMCCWANHSTAVVLTHFNGEVQWAANVGRFPVFPVGHTVGMLPPHNVPSGQGRDASAYLRFILDNWNDLPAQMIFMHDHEVDRMPWAYVSVGVVSSLFSVWSFSSFCEMP